MADDIPAIALSQPWIELIRAGTTLSWLEQHVQSKTGVPPNENNDEQWRERFNMNAAS